MQGQMRTICIQKRGREEESYFSESQGVSLVGGISSIYEEEYFLGYKIFPYIFLSSFFFFFFFFFFLGGGDIFFKSPDIHSLWLAGQRTPSTNTFSHISF